MRVEAQNEGPVGGPLLRRDTGTWGGSRSPGPTGSSLKVAGGGGGSDTERRG